MKVILDLESFMTMITNRSDICLVGVEKFEAERSQSWLIFFCSPPEKHRKTKRDHTKDIKSKQPLEEVMR